MKNILFVLLLSIITLQGCGDDDLQTARLSLDISGLEDLGPDYVYEGWVIVNGAAITTGVFDVNADGVLSQVDFDIAEETLDNASTFVLTIEPSPDPDPAPSAVHILAGDFDSDRANLTVSHGAALGDNFTSATGDYILATPTDGAADTDETSGVWWLDPSDGPGPGLDLPALPEGWIYEGWAVIDGVPFSTGRFTEVSGSDDFSGFSGSAGSPPFPGEDFLVNAPGGLSFPTDLTGQTVVISIEPVPDNSTAPFTLKPLVGPVPDNAADHTVLTMNNNASQTNPTGSVRR